MLRKHQKFLIVGIFLFLFLALYLNRSYAHIFDYDDSRNLLTLELKTEYSLTGGLGNKTLTYVALGDSLTYGLGAPGKESTFPYVIAKDLLRENKTVNVHNLAVSGAITDEVMETQLPQALELKPDVVSLMIGTNDVHDYIDKENFRNSLEEIIGHLQKETDAQILLINIPYLGTADLILPPHNLIMDERIKEFNEVIKEIAQGKNIELVDLYTKSYEPFKNNQKLYYSIDNFHPSGEGYILWGDLINGN